MTDPVDVAESHVAIVEALRAQRPAAAGREARRHVELYAKLARSARSAR
jgi:DNA-binding FadR family transcriptional regulator